jgi:type VI secretion system Hcp family effector
MRVDANGAVNRNNKAHAADRERWFVMENKGEFAMAIDSFLKLGTLKGESVVKGFEDQVQVLAWSWGMSQSGTTHTAQGGGAGKVNVQDLSFTHYVDSASPNLIKACCTGEHFDSATLTMRKAGGSALEYVTSDADRGDHIVRVGRRQRRRRPADGKRGAQFRQIQVQLPAPGRERSEEGRRGRSQLRHCQEHRFIVRDRIAVRARLALSEARLAAR